ncbi:MAG: phage holin family protein [Methylococcales bacterium]|jgi:hypothetical protein
MYQLNSEEALPFITGLWVFSLSLLSGVVTYANRICCGEVIKYPWLTFVRDVIYCQMAGLITYGLATSAGFDGFLAAALVSAGSHMGARLIIELETLILRSVNLSAKTNRFK